MNMERVKKFIAGRNLALGAFLFALASRVCFAEMDKPNVVLFFVDDLGWTDLGCYGSDFYETPQIDQLAASGVKFTQAYAACTVCSPSRAALLTGQYPARLRITDFIPGHPVSNTPLSIPDWTQQLDLDHTTVAEILLDSGYRTAHFGKWHLTPRDRNDNPNSDGDYPQYYPDKQGFEFNFGGCERGAPASYFWPYGRGATLEERKANNTYRTLPHSNVNEETYLTDHLAMEAEKLIASFGNDPFFLYFSFYNVHTPIQGRPDLVEKYSKKLESHAKVAHRNVGYAAMIESVDEAVGRVMDQIRKQGRYEDTLVIFSSDNGGYYPLATTNAPLRQGKGSFYEGAVRVPTIISWPSEIESGSVSDEPVITIDFLPTILEATGSAAEKTVKEKLDGLSLLPVLKDPLNAKLDREALYWHYPHYHMYGAVPYSAIRKGDWKLIERHDGAPLELYQLSNDVHEDRNLALVQVERAKELQRLLGEWRQSVDAQMPTVNRDYRPDRPTGWDRTDGYREIRKARE